VKSLSKFSWADGFAQYGFAVMLYTMHLKDIICHVDNENYNLMHGMSHLFNETDWPQNFGRTAGLVFAILRHLFAFLETFQEVG